MRKRAASMSARSCWISRDEGLWGELGEHGVDALTCRAGATRTPEYRTDSGDGSRSAFVPEMERKDVAAEALAALGRKLSMVPSRARRLAPSGI